MGTHAHLESPSGSRVFEGHSLSPARPLADKLRHSVYEFDEALEQPSGDQEEPPKAVPIATYSYPIANKLRRTHSDLSAFSLFRRTLGAEKEAGEQRGRDGLAPVRPPHGSPMQIVSLSASKHESFVGPETLPVGGAKLPPLRDAERPPLRDPPLRDAELPPKQAEPRSPQQDPQTGNLSQRAWREAFAVGKRGEQSATAVRQLISDTAAKLEMQSREGYFNFLSARKTTTMTTEAAQEGDGAAE